MPRAWQSLPNARDGVFLPLHGWDVRMEVYTNGYGDQYVKLVMYGDEVRFGANPREDRRAAMLRAESQLRKLTTWIHAALG